MSTNLKPAILVSCVISILFSLVSFAWTTLMSARDASLRVKQQLAFVTIAINVVLLLGYWITADKLTCQVMTTVMVYLITASFVLTFLDHANNFFSARKKKITLGLWKTFLAGLVLPLISVPITILSGIYDQQTDSTKFSMPCWRSEAMVWIHTGTAATIVLVSIVLCIITYKRAIQRFKRATSFKALRQFRFARYNILVSLAMTSLTALVWSSGLTLLVHPELKVSQLIFCLAISFQGVFGFFLYCVFALEMGLYDDLPRIRSVLDKHIVAPVQETFRPLQEDAGLNDEKETPDHEASHPNYAIDLQCTLNNMRAAQADQEDEYSETIRVPKDKSVFDSISNRQVEELCFSTLKSSIESPTDIDLQTRSSSASTSTNRISSGSTKRHRLTSSRSPQSNMNELEALFSNPDLMASYGRERKASNISASTVTVDFPQ